jgi:hypothetical protein
MTRLIRSAVFELVQLYRWAVTFEGDGSALLWTDTSVLAFTPPTELEQAERADRGGEAVLRVVLAEGERVPGCRTSGAWPRVITEVRALRPAARDPRADFEDEIPTAVIRGGVL